MWRQAPAVDLLGTRSSPLILVSLWLFQQVPLLYMGDWSCCPSCANLIILAPGCPKPARTEGGWQMHGRKLWKIFMYFEVFTQRIKKKKEKSKAKCGQWQVEWEASSHFSHALNNRAVWALMVPVLYKIIHMAARPEQGSHAVTGPYVSLFYGPWKVNDETESRHATW